MKSLRIIRFKRDSFRAEKKKNQIYFSFLAKFEPMSMPIARANEHRAKVSW
jgi:hypothetical protein